MKRFFCLLLAAGLSASSPAYAHDWTHWRGPLQTGVSLETNLPERMSSDPKAPNSNVIWKKPIGGRSAPLVLNGRVYIINNVDEGTLKEQERVMCFDANSGAVVWEYRFNVFHTDIVSSRVGWSNLASDPETGNIYAHGVQGLLICFDKDGKIVWQRSLTEEYGRVTGYGGRVTSPTVDGDLVIVGMCNASWGDQARLSNRFVAFDKKTGMPMWWSETAGGFRGTYYSIPVVAAINGERLLISGGSDGGIHAFKVRTGERVWSHPVGARAINASPVVSGNLVYISHGEENEDTNEKGRVICLDASDVKDRKPKLVWKANNIKSGYASPIIHEGRLYVPDDTAKLFCLDAKTGKQIWTYKYGRASRGSPVWADGKIYVPEVSSKFHILKPGDTKCEELYAQFFQSHDGQSVVELNGSPAVANGRIYFVTRDEIYCIGKPDAKAAAAPAEPTEAAAEASAIPTHLQIVPADVVVHPGEQVTFKARTFDAQGRFLREVQAAWSLPAPPPPPNSKESPPALRGQINAEGHLFVAKEVPSQQGIAVAKADGLTGRARVRVAPVIPYQQDFEKVPEGKVPGGWINAQGKFVVEQLNGSKVLKKTADNPNPLVCRANAYITLPGSSGYTIEADLMGTKPKNDMPDMGIVANRYTLMLDGNKQNLRLLSWEALPRVDKTIAFEWKPQTWYRMKLTVDIEGDKAIARGKVWERGKTEPKDWTIEFTDPAPNKEGSAALYGYGTGIMENEPGATAYYDNVRITPTKK